MWVCSTVMSKGMKIIVYAKEGNVKGEFLKELIDGIVPQANMEAYTTISDLSSRLHAPQLEFNIVVLIAADKEDLENILTIKPLLDNIRLILVLPDRQSETVRLGHSLHPRYLSFNDSPASDVVSVLTKMIETDSTNKNTG